MDPSLFQSAEAGRLVPVDTATFHDHAFLPTALSPRWRLDDGIHLLLPEATGALGRLEGITRVPTNPDLLLRPLRRREALKSSSLEGTYATPDELLLFDVDEPGATTRNEVREVANYARAMALGVDRRSALPFSTRFIRELHECLLTDVRGADKRPGDLRDTQVTIGSDRRFIPPPPAHVQPLLDDLERAMNAPPPDVHALLWCFAIHYQFETIHPFRDGNGRVGRLLLSLMIADLLGHARPILFMSPWFERHKDEYIDALFGISARDDWNAWFDLCLRGVVNQADDATRRFDELLALQRDFQQRASRSGGSVRLTAIIDDLFTQTPLTTAPNVASAMNVTYPTAKADLERLRDLDIVTRIDDHHPRLYIARGVIRLGIEDFD